jgi:hypothetical protein
MPETPHRPITGAMQPLIGGRAPAAILILYCDLAPDPAMQCSTRPPICQGLLKAHIASVCFKCFRCILQVFHMHVVKVDLYVAYVAMTIHVCCKRLFQMFYLFSDVCCKCVYMDIACISHLYMLQMFYLDVAYVLQCDWLLSVFRCFCKFFNRMFHLSSDVCFKCFYLDV